MLTRRGFIAATAATGAAQVLPRAVTAVRGRWVLKLVYDKALGGLRAVERWVP